MGCCTSINTKTLAPATHAGTAGSLRPALHIARIPTSQEKWERCLRLYKAESNPCQAFFAADPQLFKNLLVKFAPHARRWEVWKAALEYTDCTEEFYTLAGSDTVSEYEPLIVKDVGRTFATLPLFEQDTGQQSLKNVLLAIAHSNPDVGYCQGMNYIAAVLLIVSGGNEVESFGVFDIFFKRLGASGLYENGFPLLDVLAAAVHERLSEACPELEQNLQALEIQDSLWLSKWLLTFFAYSFCIDDVVRMMDLIVAQGLGSLLGLSLSVLTQFKKKLLAKDNLEVSEFLCNLKNARINAEKVIQRAVKFVFELPELVASLPRLSINTIPLTVNDQDDF